LVDKNSGKPVIKFMSKHFIFIILVFTTCLFVFWTATASAQFDFARNEPDGARYFGGPRLGKRQTQIWRTGVIIEPGAAISHALITIPVPMQWKEQRIINVNEEKMDANLASHIEYRQSPHPAHGGAMEMRLQLGNMELTKPLEIVVAFELENYELLPPDNPSQYVIPKQVPPEIKQYLQASPKIESNESVFKGMYNEITKGRNTDWEKVEALYAFVQNNVKYDNAAWKRPAKGALAVTKMPRGQWTGDCKDMSCLFVALCRAGKIPARIVRVPEHCYAEFYLELKQEGRKNTRNTPPSFWFPCQVSGTYAFGGIPERRVILQKGDSFPFADKPGRTLFMEECFQGALEPGSPPLSNPRWVHNAELKQQ
jgi:hypothetical protein